MNDGQELLLVLVALYFLPSLIAGARKHNSTPAIVLLNTFLGWTIAGWFWSLFFALTSDTKDHDKRKARLAAEEMYRAMHGGEPPERPHLYQNILDAHSRWSLRGKRGR
jgi:hypothetical protein